MKSIFFLVLLSIIFNTANAQAVAWELSAEPGNQATNNATFQNTNFNNCVLSRGAGITATAGAGSMNSSAWFSGATPTTLANAITGNDYYEFTINTINCLFFNPTSIKIVLRSSATGPNTATLRCSSDAFASDIGTASVTTTSTEFTFSETISPNSQSVTYRLYGYGGAAGGGTPGSGGTMRIGTSIVATDNDLQVFASTTFVAVNQESNIVVNNGDFVPASSFVGNVPGATFDWTRTPESIGLVPTNGIGNVPSFNALNASGSPITSTFTVQATSGNCTSVGMIYTITVNPALCTITSVNFLGNPGSCNDNGTPNDPTDDFFTQNIQANFFNRPTTGSLQIVPGGDQIGTYSIPVNQIIGNSHIFNSVQLKADGTSSIIQMNFTADPSCINTGTGPVVQPCSSPPPACTITSINFLGNPGSCNDNGTPNDPMDDFFTQNIQANFFNRPATGSLQIVPGGDQIGAYSIPVNQIIGNSHIFNSVQLKADGTSSIIQMNFTADPSCINTGTGPVVQPCSAPAGCAITSVTLQNIGPCNDNGTSNITDDYFTADVQVVFNNPPATGNLEIELPGDVVPGGGATSISVTNLTSPHTFTGVRFKADGTTTVIEVDFTADQACVRTSTAAAVQPCSAPCDISNVALQNIGPCNDNGTSINTDDYFTADVNVTFSNPPATGNLEIELPGDVVPGGGSTTVTVTNLTSPHIFTGVRFKADGTVTVIEVDFTADQGCVRTITAAAVQPCSSSPPVVSCPGSVTVSCVENVPVPNPASVSETHDCPGNVTITHVSDVNSNITCINRFTITRTYRVTDQCGHTSTCTQIIIVNDQTPPTVTCPPNLQVSCASDVPAVNVSLLGVTDNCTGTLGISRSFLGEVITNQTCPNRFTLTRTYRGGDACGNTATCTQVITVFDNTGPAMTCPNGVTVQCASDIPAPNIQLVTSTDNCNGAATITFVNDVISNQTCANKFTVTRTYKATDVCGNSSTCTQLIIVNDNTAPLLTCPPGVTVQCASQVPAPNIALVTATDNCSGVPTITFVSDVITNQTCTNKFTITRIYRATDICGNSATCTQTITINDTTVPTLTCPVNVTVQCASLVPAINTASVATADNCGPAPTVTFVSDVISNQTCSNRFIVTRTYRSTDACGNSATCTQIITVFDNIAPVITFADPLIVNVPNGGRFDVQCYGQDPNWSLPTLDENSVTVNDNCSGAVTVGFSQVLQDEGNCPVDGYITLYKLTWTAIDECGNSSTKYAYMTLVDHIAPVLINIPANITVNCDEIPDVPTNVYATDECISASDLQYLETHPVPGCQNGQVITRTWIATDLCGNMTTETQYITLVDITPPVLLMLQPELAGITDETILKYTCNEGGIPEFYDDLNAESVYSSPSCGSNAIIKFDKNTIHSVNCKRAGYLEQQTFHWYAIDNCGNETSLTIIAQLVDRDAPVISGVPDMTCIDDSALKFIEATDNCGEAFLRYWDIKIPNPCGAGFAIRRTYEANDYCGNVSRDTAILIPNDHASPVLQFVNPKLQDLSPGEVLLIECAGHTGDYTPFGVEDVSVQDGCTSEVNVTFNEKVLESNGCTNGIVATLSLEWTATDLCGNVSKLTIPAFIIDHTPPVILNFKPEIFIRCNDSLPKILVTDNCGEVHVDIALSILHHECEYKYDVLRVISATDPCGNTTTEQQTIHVGNESGPIISGVVPELCDDLSIPEVTAFDPCSGTLVAVTMSEIQIESSCRDGRVIERTWTASDACGNISTAKQIIITGDKTPPAIQIPTYSIILKYLDAPGKNFVKLSDTDIIDQLDDLDDGSVYVEDECDLQVIPQFNIDVTYSENCAGEGYFEHRVYTWTAADVCGNVASISFDVYIIDDIPPVLSGVPKDATIICASLPEVPTVSSIDPAQPVSIVYTQDIQPGDAVGEFNVIRTWTGTDACGNVTVSSQHITWTPDTYIACDIIIPPLVECNSHGVVISSIITGGLGAVTYEWEVEGAGFIQSGQGTDEITIYVGWTELVIHLKVIDAYGCYTECSAVLDCIDSAINPLVGSSQITTPETMEDMDFDIITDQATSGILSAIILWPNPANESINLSFDSRANQEIRFSLINFLGQDLLNEKIVARKGYNMQNIDVSHIPEGSYLMEVKSEMGMYTKVVVIIRK